MHQSAQARPATPRVLLGSRPSAVPMLRISAQGLPERKRLHLLREVMEPLGVRYEAKRIHGDPIEVDLTLQGLPGLQLFSGRMQGAHYRRTRQSVDPTDDVCLMFNPQGRHLIGQRGRELVLGDGEAALVSLTDPLESQNRPPGNFLVLRLPKSQLAPRLAVRQDHFMRRIPQDNAALRLLTKYVAIARQDSVLADRGAQQMVVSHVSDLMAVAIGATRDAAEVARRGGCRAALLHAIKGDISRRLMDADLSVETIATSHGLSPRFVQRLFEADETTFTEHVLAQRLARAHRLLTDTRRAYGKISAIAYDCGFNDVSYFNRVFRRQYGIAPSDVRAQAQSEQA